MKLSILSTLLTLASTVMSAPSVTLGFEKRNPSGSFKLVAYGIAPSAIDFFYSDGLAYVGDSSKWTGQVTTDITFRITDTRIYTTATSAGVTLDAETLFYIRPTENEVLPVGFTGNGHAAPGDARSDGFIFYGTYLMWDQGGGQLASSFRLKETGVGGVYQVYWDTSSLYPDGYLLPVVKSKNV